MVRNLPLVAAILVLGLIPAGAQQVLLSTDFSNAEAKDYANMKVIGNAASMTALSSALSKVSVVEIGGKHALQFAGDNARAGSLGAFKSIGEEFEPPCQSVIKGTVEFSPLPLTNESARGVFIILLNSSDAMTTGGVTILSINIESSLSVKYSGGVAPLRLKAGETYRVDYSVDFSDEENHTWEFAIYDSANTSLFNSGKLPTRAQHVTPAIFGLTAWGGSGFEPFVRFNSVKLEKVDLKPEDLGVRAKLRPTSDRMVQVYKPGETVRLEMEISNPFKAPIEGAHVDWRVKSWYGEEVKESKPVVLLPGTTKVAFGYKPGKLGWYAIAAELRQPDGKLIRSFAYSIAVSDPVKSKGEYFHYGICAHIAWHHGTDYDKEFALLGEAGADMVRDGALEGAHEWQKKSDFARGDAYLENLDRIGVKLQSIFSLPPEIASKEEALLEYVRAVAPRYKGRVKYWEYANEPDISRSAIPPGKYAESLNAIFQEFALQDPEVECMNGGLAMVKRAPNPDFVEKFVPLVDQKNWRIFAYHDYNTFLNMGDRFRSAVKPVYDKAGLKMPVWINEGGFNMLLPGGGEKKQAIELAKKYAGAPALGIGAYFWYDLRDDGTKPENKEHHFGLTTHGFLPKASFATFQTAVRELSPLRYVSSLDGRVPADAYAFLYRNEVSGSPKPNVLVAWREGENRMTPVWISGEKDFRVSGANDLMGNPVEAALSNDGAAASLGGEPVYFHYTGSPENVRITALLDTPLYWTILPGKPAEIPLVINNPTRRDEHVRLAADTANLPGIRWSFSDSNPLVKAGGSVEVRATATPGKEAGTPRDKAGSSVITLKFQEANFAAQAVVPTSMAIAIPKSKVPLDISAAVPKSGALAFDLRTSDSVFNLYSAEPAPQMQWLGPDDLSAVATLVCDDAALHLSVDVTDDVHLQPALDRTMEQGDSLQITLRPEGEKEPDALDVGFAMANDGKTGGWVFSKTRKATIPTRALDPASLPFAISRTGHTTSYRVAIPWKTLGLNGPPPNGFRFNFFVNDSDKTVGRKQWLRLSGDASGYRNPGNSPIFVCQ